MKYPARVVCDIRAEGYSVTVMAADGTPIFQSKSAMKSAGSASGGKDIFKCAALKDFDKFAEAVDDISLDLFGVAGELYSIADDVA